jgi:hypothetical protein
LTQPHDDQLHLAPIINWSPEVKFPPFCEEH